MKVISIEQKADDVRVIIHGDIPARVIPERLQSEIPTSKMSIEPTGNGAGAGAGEHVAIKNSYELIIHRTQMDDVKLALDRIGIEY